MGDAVIIESRFEDNLPTLEIDPDRIRQVLNNLVKNAMEAGEDHTTPRLEIATRSIEESGRRYLEMRVTDNGPGIEKEMLEQIFEPYSTNKPKGTGLGLAIVKKIIEEHGGVVWLDNRPEGGVCAVIKLPLQPVAGQTVSFSTSNIKEKTA